MVSSDPRWINRILVAEEATCHSGTECFKHRVQKTSYDRMDSLLMALGFTKSKVDSNLCFKVEGGRLVMLLLYVDPQFSRHGGVVECGWNFPRTREVCSRDLEEV